MVIDAKTIHYFREHATFVGSESSIYRDKNILYKIFDNPDIESKNREERLIPLLHKKHLSMIGQIPMDVLRDESKKIIGVVLPFIEGKKAYKYIRHTNDFGKILQISKIMKRFHEEDIALADVSLDNFLITPQKEVIAIDLTSVYINGYASHICSKLLLNHYEEEVYVEDMPAFAFYLDKVSLYLIYLNCLTNKSFETYREDVYYRMLERFEMDFCLKTVYEKLKEPLLYASDIPYLHEWKEQELVIKPRERAKVYTR